MKDLLVYLDGSKADENRIAHAEALATRHNAFLTGLYCNQLPEVMIASEAGMASVEMVAQMQETARHEGDAKAAALLSRFDRLGVLNEIRRFDTYSSQLGSAISGEARTADLFIATRPYGSAGSNHEALESVLFNSGRACLFVPPTGTPRPFDAVLLAWRNSREAARAVSEALPILVAAKQVIVAMVSEGESPEEQGISPGADIARYLDRHGAKVTLRTISGWSNAGEALLNEAEKTAADLLVMGGYGHSRFREWILGGVTRNILTNAEIPVFVAH